MSNKTKIVVAGNFAQAQLWAKELGLDPWSYAVNEMSFVGRYPGTEVHYVGTWQKHPAYRGSLGTVLNYLFASGHLVRIYHDPDTGAVL